MVVAMKSTEQERVPDRIGLLFALYLQTFVKAVVSYVKFSFC